mgnify:CR=1 FL=1|tara:strand:+ start:323 stop:493 length:171 start_codon:yes stop_codon:yes gene_type:complete
MDNYITNDPNNPINQQTETNYCNICNIEENKTYFVDDTNICEDCINEKEEEEEAKK